MEEENLRQYELGYFLSPQLSPEEIFDFPQKFNSFLNEIQGKMEGSKEPKIQKLAFPIKKLSQGYYGEIKFLANPEKISPLEKKLNLEKGILRFSIVVAPKVKEEFEKPPKKPGIKLFKKPAPPPEPQIKLGEKKEKIKLEEIDKKLEEILGNV